MAAKRVIGADGTGDEVGILGDAIVDGLAPIAIGPAVEAAFLDGGEVVGRNLVAEAVTLRRRRSRSKRKQRRE